MKMKKLIAEYSCPQCGKRFNKASNVAIINNNLILHASGNWPCAMKYISASNMKLPEKERKIIGKYEFLLRFSPEYESSDKSISEAKFEEYQKMFAGVFMPANPLILKLAVRERIWKSMERKYKKQLQYIHTLSEIWNKKKDTYRSNFKKTFIPSVLSQFKSKGYLSKKQWALVESLIESELKEYDEISTFREKVANAIYGDLHLPDKLRVQQRKHSFFRMYNKQEGIEDEE